MRSRTLLAAAAAVLVAAAAATVVFTRHSAGAAAAPIDETAAARLIDGYRQAAVAQLPASIRYTEAIRDMVACPDKTGQYTVSANYNLMPEVITAGQAAMTTLGDYWKHRGYQVLDETGGQNAQLIVEDPANGFRLDVNRREAQYLQLAITSPCLVPTVPPPDRVLLQDLATALGTYGQYAAGVLAELSRDVSALDAALARNDLAGARTAWLAAQLCWDRVGAAYGTFGDFADAIDGLPQQLPGGTGDPNFTGLHRVEYGLWHGESAPRVRSVAARLGRDVGDLRAGLTGALPGPHDLPLRVHEVLEDALRFDLEGLTDQGGGAGLAETAAAVDATAELLDIFGPLLDVQRPSLVPAARAGLEALRRGLLATRRGTAWTAPAALDPSVRRQLQADLGAVLETLADVPGLLETAGS